MSHGRPPGAARKIVCAGGCSLTREQGPSATWPKDERRAIPLEGGWARAVQQATRERAHTMKRDEAERLAHEIDQTPGWQAMEVFEMPHVNTRNDEYGVRAWHQASGTIETIPSRSAWDILKAKFTTP